MDRKPPPRPRSQAPKRKPVIEISHRPPTVHFKGTNVHASDHSLKQPISIGSSRNHRGTAGTRPRSRSMDAISALVPNTDLWTKEEEEMIHMNHSDTEDSEQVTHPQGPSSLWDAFLARRIVTTEVSEASESSPHTSDVDVLDLNIDVDDPCIDETLASSAASLYQLRTSTYDIAERTSVVRGRATYARSSRSSQRGFTAEELSAIADAVDAKKKAAEASQASVPSPSGTKTAEEYQYAHFLRMSKSENFTACQKHRFIYIADPDEKGRPVVVVLANRFPAHSVSLDTVLLYILSIIHPISTAPFVVFLVTTGLSGKHRPPFKWIRKVHSAFPRSIRKQLKQVYILHPTFWVTMTLRLLRPLLRPTAIRKLVLWRDVQEALDHFPSQTRALPPEILRKDPGLPIFGVSLDEAISRNRWTDSGLPLVVESCVRYLNRCLETQGLFRLSGSAAQIQALKALFDAGEDVVLDHYKDVHAIAGLLKLYLREMPDPIFPVSLLPTLLQAHQAEDWDANATEILYHMPQSNFNVLRVVVRLLARVASCQDVNRMGPANLAIVFAPNVMPCFDSSNVIEMMQHTPVLNGFMEQLIRRVHIFRTIHRQ